uniref:Uncharacterized protein LOC116944682 isoform X1 n=1 Tax=Petromyzon marinus TaxID=7757 RepID=A0AAJ7TCV6_PETMA|nr:uncharacterized protein LOC116944682 isoform X1 [Petromyzon marinus]
MSGASGCNGESDTNNRDNSSGKSTHRDKKRPPAMSSDASSEESMPSFKKRRIKVPKGHSGPSSKGCRSPSKERKPRCERETAYEGARGIMLKSLRVVLHKLNIAGCSSDRNASGITRKSTSVGVKAVANVPEIHELQPKSPVHIAKLCSHCSQWIEDFSRPHVCSPHYSGMRSVLVADINNTVCASPVSEIEESLPPTDEAALNIENNAGTYDIAINRVACNIVTDTEASYIATDVASIGIANDVGASDIENDGTVANIPNDGPVGDIATDVRASNIVTEMAESEVTLPNSELSESIFTSLSDPSGCFESQGDSSSPATLKGKSLRSGRNSVQFCHRCHQKINSNDGLHAHMCFGSSGQTWPEEKNNFPQNTAVEFSPRGLNGHYNLTHGGIRPSFNCPLCNESIKAYLNLKLHYNEHMQEEKYKTNAKPLQQLKFSCAICKDKRNGKRNGANESTTVIRKKVCKIVQDPNAQVFCCMQCNFQHPVLRMVKKHSLQKHSVNLECFSSEEQAAQALRSYSLMSPCQRKDEIPEVNASGTPDETSECDSTTVDDVSVDGGLSAPLLPILSGNHVGTVDVMRKPDLLMLGDGEVLEKSNLLMQSTTKSVPLLQENTSVLQKTINNRPLLPVIGSRILIPANYTFEVLGVKLVDGKKQVVIKLKQKTEVDSIKTTENNNGARADNSGASKNSGKTKSLMKLVQFKLASNNDGDKTNQPSSVSSSIQEQEKNSDSSETIKENQVSHCIDVEDTVSSSVREVVTHKETQQDPEITIVDNLAVPASSKCKRSIVESLVKGAQVTDNPSSHAKRICWTRLDSSQVIKPIPQSTEKSSLTPECAHERATNTYNVKENRAVSEPPDLIDEPEVPDENRIPENESINNLGNASTPQSGTVQVNAASVVKDASVLSDDLKEIEGEISLHELKGCNGMLMMKNIASRRQTFANADGSETDVAEEIKLIATNCNSPVKVLDEFSTTADLKHDQYLLGDSSMNPDIILSSESKFDSVPKRGRPKKHSSKPLLKSKQKSTLSDANEHALPISQSVEFPITPSSGELSEQLQEDCVEAPTDESHSQIPIAKAVNQIIEPLCTVTELSSGEPLQREECNPLDLTQPLVSHSRHEMLPIENRLQSTSASVLPPALPPADTQLSLDSNQSTTLTCTIPSPTTLTSPPVIFTSVLPEMPGQPLKTVQEKPSVPMQPDLGIMACNSTSTVLTPETNAVASPTTMQFTLPPHILEDLVRKPGSKVFIPVKGASKLSPAHFPFYVKLTNGRVMKIMPSVPKSDNSAASQEPTLLDKSTKGTHHPSTADIPQSSVVSKVIQNVMHKKVSSEMQNQCQAPTQQPTYSFAQPAPLMLTKQSDVSPSSLPMPVCTTVVTLPSTLSFQPLVGGQTTVLTSTIGVSTTTTTRTATTNQMAPKSFIISNSQSIMIPSIMNQNAPFIFFSVGANSGPQIACPENVLSGMMNGDITSHVRIPSQNMPPLMIPVPPLKLFPTHTISAATNKADNLHRSVPSATVQLPPPPPIIIKTYPSSAKPIQLHFPLISTQALAKACNTEKSSQHTLNVFTPLSAFDKGFGSMSPSQNLLTVGPTIAVSSKKPPETMPPQPIPLIQPLASANLKYFTNAHVLGSSVLDSQKQTEISQHDGLLNSTAAINDSPVLKDSADSKLITQPMCPAENHEPHFQVAWDDCRSKPKDVGPCKALPSINGAMLIISELPAQTAQIGNVKDLRDIEKETSQTTTNIQPASISSPFVQGELCSKSQGDVPSGFLPNVVISKMASSELISNMNCASVIYKAVSKNGGYADNAHEMAKRDFDLKSQLDQNKSSAESTGGEVHIDGRAKSNVAIHSLDTEESTTPRTLSDCVQRVSRVYVSNDRDSVAKLGQGEPASEAEDAAATLMALAHCGELISNTRHAIVNTEIKKAGDLKSASKSDYVVAPKTLASGVESTSKVSNVTKVVSEADMREGKPVSEPETDVNFDTQGEPGHVTFANVSPLKRKIQGTNQVKIKIRKPTCKPQSVMASTDMKTQARSAYLATCISYFREKHNTALRVVKTKPNSPSNEACLLPISVRESKEQFTKPARTLKKKVDDKELQTDNACSSFSSQLPLSLPIKPLYIKQAHKKPRANQPVVVLNHPYIDPQEVVNLMRTVNMYPGCIIKVVLSRRTLAAMEASKQEQRLLKQISVHIAKDPTSRPGGQTTKEHHKMLEQRRGILKMKLRRMSSNSYQVVHTAVHTRTCTSQKTRFSCWFCGRVFSGQEEWVSHGQRHLSEATRNWGTIFPSAIAKAAFSTTLAI